MTEEGLSYLKEKLLKNTSTNPTQFVSMTKIKISCSDILNDSEREQLFNMLKTNLLKLKTETEQALSENWTKNTYHKLVLNNTICEYKNLIDLIEELK